jgi:hypothetical protein
MHVVGVLYTCVDCMTKMSSWHVDIGMTEVGMMTILQSDQDLILDLSRLVAPRMIEGPLVPRTTGGPLMQRMTGDPLVPRTTGGPLVPRKTGGPLMQRMTGDPLVPRRMATVQMIRRIGHLADLRAPGVMIAVLQGLVHGLTGMNFHILFNCIVIVPNCCQFNYDP